jgi:hypothetical protein
VESVINRRAQAPNMKDLRRDSPIPFGYAAE